MKAPYSISDKPLDFSFLKLTDIAQLRKEGARDGKRKPIAESDEDDDQKKVSYTFKSTTVFIFRRLRLLTCPRTTSLRTPRKRRRVNWSSVPHQINKLPRSSSSTTSVCHRGLKALLAASPSRSRKTRKSANKRSSL